MLFYILRNRKVGSSWHPGVETYTEISSGLLKSWAVGQRQPQTLGPRPHPAPLPCSRRRCSHVGDQPPPTVNFAIKGTLVTLCLLPTGHLSPYSMFLISMRGKRGVTLWSWGRGRRSEQRINCLPAVRIVIKFRLLTPALFWLCERNLQMQPQFLLSSAFLQKAEWPKHANIENDTSLARIQLNQTLGAEQS